MEIIQNEENGIICIAIRGRLDSKSAKDADLAIKDILAGNHCRLLFDLSALEYLSSSGLRVLLKASKKIEQKEGKMMLCALNIFVREVFEETNFPIADSVKIGMQAFL